MRHSRLLIPVSALPAVTGLPGEFENTQANYTLTALTRHVRIGPGSSLGASILEIYPARDPRMIFRRQV
jgi:hypothetical protein